jgi:hypothetical protein
MNGHSHEASASGGIPKLYVEIPDGLQIEFSERSPRQIVARRTIKGKRKSDVIFELRNGEWYGPKGEPLTDDDIRICLTYDGIEPAFL